MKSFRIFLAVVASSFTQGVMANDTCINSAATYYKIPPSLLEAIAHVESGHDPRKVGANGNSYDVGYMQINSYWWPLLKQYGVKMNDLFHACTNIYWGAWILSQDINRYGLTWKAVGAYNAKTPEKQKRYAWKIYRAMNRSSP
ncbi:MAG: lytic transglycosylase domain-containing protein [Sulfuricaulis sp.]